MCYMLDQGAQSKIQGTQTNTLFEIASVSKVVTSYWSLRGLGPNYRFSTHIFVTPVSGRVVDVHIQGARDPFWGRQLTHFLFSELNRKGIQQIRHLSFDENFDFRWAVVTDNTETIHPTPTEITDSLARHIRDLSSEYRRTQQEASALGVNMLKSVSLHAQSISFLAKADFKPTSSTSSFQLRSAPLARYLKEMNVVSNNQVADRLFELMGGAGYFRSFLQADMKMDDRDIQFINGSGNVIIASNGNKDYNKATCETIVRILYRMNGLLKTNYQMSLKDVMAVSGSDGGTLSPRFDPIPNSMVAKTGTVDPAVTLTGVLSAGQGEVYFGVFADTDSESDWETARDMVRDRVMDLFKLFGGRKTFAYAARDFLPFDQYSAFTPEVKQLSIQP